MERESLTMLIMLSDVLIKFIVLIMMTKPTLLTMPTKLTKMTIKKNVFWYHQLIKTRTTLANIVIHENTSKFRQ